MLVAVLLDRLVRLRRVELLKLDDLGVFPKQRRQYGHGLLFAVQIYNKLGLVLTVATAPICIGHEV